MIELIIVGGVALIIMVLLIFWAFKERDKAVRLSHDNAVLGERLSVQAEQYDRLENTLSREREELTQQFSKDFAILASDILEQKSVTMTATARESIFSLLQPLGDNLKDFKERIEIESKNRFALANEVKRLSELNAQMSREAQNLTDALKGNSKSQGDWGEMILETMLENSGLKRGTHFKVQENIKNEEGRNLRPDVILMLPEQKQIVIDSKVSLTAYVNYVDAIDDAARNRALAAHVSSLRGHINELGAKRYDKIIGSSPDFVIMFIPNEPALIVGLQSHNELWSEAYAKGVILSSPSNLFGILRIVADLWRHEKQSKSMLEIARQGGDLYDKFVLFVDTFNEVGKAIAKANDAHEKALGQLSTGNGNLIRRAERLKQLGVKTTKQMTVEEQDDEIAGIEE